jgi:hypothetical protein
MASDWKNLPGTAQTDTTTVAFSGVTENDLLWAGVCPGQPALPCPVCHQRQTDTTFAFIYKMDQGRMLVKVS